MRIESIRGQIVGCSELEQYTTKAGETRVKCTLHIVGNEVSNNDATSREDEHAGRAERAITCSGDLTNWLGCIGSQVEVRYIQRVFGFKKDGAKQWYGNDLYAISINSI